MDKAKKTFTDHLMDAIKKRQILIESELKQKPFVQGIKGDFKCLVCLN